MQLVLVRHPQPSIEKNVCYGSSDVDVDCSEIAKHLPYLRQQFPPNALLFSSPLRRCAKLAQALAQGTDLPICIDDRLVEMHFGRWELQTWDQIARAEIDAWASDTENYLLGGGESVMQMAERVAAFYDEVVRLKKTCMVICHAGTIRLLIARHLGFTPIDMAKHAIKNNAFIAYGELLVLECD